MSRSCGRSHSLVSALLAMTVVMLWGASSAQAEVVRYAVVIGNNLGDPDEDRLRYAEKDAEAMAKVLGEMGQVAPENLVRLMGAEVPKIVRTLTRVDARIRAHRKRKPDDEIILFIYYSGHADAGALHIDGGQLSFSRIRSYLKSSAAQVAVLILDACRSGEMTRVKGAKPAPAFRLEDMERIDSQGVAIITSSSAGENSQESDRLRGSYFTHHLLAGLLGAADKSGDGQITLGEAYQHAYNETLRSTSKVRYVQHPTYAFQIRGRRDIIVTRLDASRRKLGRLVLAAKGTYMLFEGDASGTLVTEFTVAKERVSLALKPGAYFLRRRDGRAIFEGKATVKRGATTKVKAAAMTRTPYGQVARKGFDGEDLGTTWTVSFAGGAGGAMLDAIDPVLLGLLGVQADMRSLSVQLRGRFGRGTTRNDFLAIATQQVGLELGLLRYLDLGPFAFGAGLRVGGDWVRQSFATTGRAPERDSLVGRTGATLQVVLAPLPWMSLFLQGDADITVGGVEDARGARELDLRFVPLVLGGLSFHMR